MGLCRLQRQLHETVEKAKADGQLDPEEESLLKELKDKLDRLNEEITQLTKREDVPEKKRQIQSFDDLVRLLDRAVGFVYVASNHIDPELARVLTLLHAKLITKRLNPLFPQLGGPLADHPFLGYARRTLPVVPGVVVLTNAGGWPGLPHPWDYAAFKEELAASLIRPRSALMPALLLNGPLVRTLSDQIQAPAIFFDTVDIEYEVKTFSLTIGPVTLQLPWEAKPVVRYRVYVVDTEMIRDRTASGGTYAYIEKDFKKVLGPFLSAVFSP